MGLQVSRTAQGGGRQSADVQLAKQTWTVDPRIVQLYLADSVAGLLPPAKCDRRVGRDGPTPPAGAHRLLSRQEGR